MFVEIFIEFISTPQKAVDYKMEDRRDFLYDYSYLLPFLYTRLFLMEKIRFLL